MGTRSEATASAGEDAAAKPRSATERVYSLLKQDILTAHRTPESFLYEFELAEEYGVSKTPVREALRLLAHEGWVTVLPRKGYLVRSLRLEDVHDIFEVRQMIEPPMAATAAERATDQDKQELEALLLTQEQATDAEAAFHAATGFHLAIARISRNARAEKILGELMDELYRMRYLAPWLDNRLQESDELTGHRSILDAILSGDTEAARQTMDGHSRESLRKKVIGLGSLGTTGPP
ncbi:GntR family transcriptional regulator [Citricoccus sp.]|uniref:GntR family transcriptional regulator n=1 Tax=Citricoccus sp. TaxID=1978372 RepID=UPI0028BEE8DA|nr:GntR family transcriptional regulator [Citricoccus sp.]